MSCTPCDEKKAKRVGLKAIMSDSTPPPTPTKERLVMHCFCGLMRLLPENLKTGDEFRLVACPKCGSPFHGVAVEGGAMEVVGG